MSGELKWLEWLTQGVCIVLEYGIYGEFIYQDTFQSHFKYDPSFHSRSEKTN